MYRTYLLLIALLFCSFITNAQQDSLKYKLQQKQLYFSDSTTAVAFDFVKKNPLFYDLLPKQISAISLGYQLEKGKFIPAQGSTKTNTGYLASEGTTVLSGIKLYGAFSYRRVFEDSTRFAQQTRNNTTTPYYYGSAAYNHYERSIYDFKAMGAKNIFADKITLGLGIDYHIADHFATNDPRGSIKEYQLNVKSSVGLNFNKNVSIGLGYTLGYGQETVTIGYKNRAYYESIIYPNYVNYLINGYGEPIPKTSDRNYGDRQNRSGLSVSFKAENTDLGSFYGSAELVNEQQNYDIRSGSGILKLSSYELSKTTADLLWLKKAGNGTLSAVVNYQNLAGEDYNLKYLAKNYIYTGNNLSFKLNYSQPKNKTIFNYLVGATQTAAERLDGITGNQVYFKNLLLNAGFGLHQTLANNRSFCASIGANYGLPLADRFIVGTATESTFTRTVIFHDYLYNTSTRIGGSFAADYSFPFFKTMQSAIAINLAYSTQNNLKTLNRTLLSTPGSDRLFSNVSFNLYF